MKRKLSALLMCAAMFCCAALPAQAYAAAAPEVEVIRIEHGDFTVETVLTVYPALSRAQTARADKVQTFKYGGEVIAEVTLSATFGYDGDEAWVVEAEGDSVTYDGWRYGSEEIEDSGGTVTLSAQLTKAAERTLNVDISMTCSPSGTIR